MSALENKRAATEAGITLGLQPDLRARAVVLVAADSTRASDLQNLIQLNGADPGLKALIEEFCTQDFSGKSTSCTSSM